MKPDWPDRYPEPDDWKLKAEFAGLLLLALFVLAVAVVTVVPRFV